jgi:hypothetical protein
MPRKHRPADDTAQLSLFKEKSIQARFEAYDKAHPEVYVELVAAARRLRQKGRRRFGVKTIWERMRWTLEVEADGDYKFNNNYTSRYVRKMLAEYPEFEGMFELRRLRA